MARWRRYGRSCVACGAALLAAVSCAAIPTPHENFLLIMGSNVGKHVDNPLILWNRYADWRAGIRILENGNAEHEFRWRTYCPVFFEVDPNTRLIVGWRFEGRETDCQIVP